MKVKDLVEILEKYSTDNGDNNLWVDICCRKNGSNKVTAMNYLADDLELCYDENTISITFTPDIVEDIADNRTRQLLKELEEKKEEIERLKSEIGDLEEGIDDCKERY